MDDRSSEDLVFYAAPGVQGFGPMTCYPDIDPAGVPRLVVHVGVAGSGSILSLSLGTSVVRRLAAELPSLETMSTHLWAPVRDD